MSKNVVKIDVEKNTNLVVGKHFPYKLTFVDSLRDKFFGRENLTTISYDSLPFIKFNEPVRAVDINGKVVVLETSLNSFVLSTDAKYIYFFSDRQFMIDNMIIKEFITAEEMTL